MTEYIDREAVIDRFKALGLGEHNLMERVFADCVYHILENFPRADVAPVVHSYWEGYSCSQFMGIDEDGEPKWRDGRFYVCHNYRCRRKTVVKSNYCPNCGAKMDGGIDNETD